MPGKVQETSVVLKMKCTNFINKAKCALKSHCNDYLAEQAVATLHYASKLTLNCHLRGERGAHANDKVDLMTQMVDVDLILLMQINAFLQTGSG